MLEEDGDGPVIRMSSRASVLLVGGWGVRRVVEETKSVGGSWMEGVEKGGRELFGGRGRVERLEIGT